MEERKKGGSLPPKSIMTTNFPVKKLARQLDFTFFKGASQLPSTSVARPSYTLAAQPFLILPSSQPQLVMIGSLPQTLAQTPPITPIRSI